MATNDLWAIVPELLDHSNYMVLGTVSPHGKPWVTPLFFASRNPEQLFWVSSPDSKHSTNIESHKGISVTVFDSHAPIGDAEAIYMAGVAELASMEVENGLEIINAKLPDGRTLSASEVGSGMALAVYRADIHRFWVLARGNDERFENDVDSRVEVTPH